MNRLQTNSPCWSPEFLKQASPVVLVGIAGAAGAGKSTAANHLCRHYGFVQAAFAEPIKLMLEALFEHCGVDYAHLYEPDLKERPLPAPLGAARACANAQPMTARRLMQTLGTEWARVNLRADFWVDVMDAHLGMASGFPVHDRIVVDDVRMANEAGWIKRQPGGVLWRMANSRPLDRVRLAEGARNHASECGGVPANLVDHELVNDGSPIDLAWRVDRLMADMGLGRRPPVVE